MNNISIIIPVYNGENYIIQLLDSISIQARNNLCEIIVVENGSLDNTIKILKEYRQKNSIVKVYQSEKGVSKARNLGIKKASGKYVMFVDADDQLLKDSINQINHDIESNYDLYVYSFIKGKLEAKESECKKIILNYKSDNLIDYINWIISKPTLRASAWAKVYKKSVIIDNDIYFNEDLKYSEDSEFLLRYIKYVKTIEVLPNVIYKYVLSPNSSMRSTNNDRIGHYIKSMNCSIREYKDTPYMNSLYLYILTNFNILLVHDVFVYKSGKKINEMIKVFKNIYKNSIFEFSVKKTSINKFLCKELIVEFFLKLKLNIFAYLLCYFKSYLNQK